MTKKKRVEYVARLRRHYEFKVAKPWQLEWLRSMGHQEQRLIADDLDEYSLENCLLWWARNQFFLHCPDRIMRWRVLWWCNVDCDPRISYARQLAGAGEYVMSSFDDTELFEYEPYTAVNDNPHVNPRLVH